jgi:hypothetical protein
MATTVLDSNNLEAIVKDATGEGLAPPTKEGAKPADGVAAETTAKEKPAASDQLDVEGEDGLTAREKAELSAKMLKAVGKRVREKREAEEFAAEQYNLRVAAERRAKELEEQVKAAPAQRQVVAEAKPKPVRENFATDAEYIEAATNHAVTEALAKKAADDAKAADEARQAEILANASARIAKAIELVPDFEDVTSTVDAIIPPAVAGYMQESEMFAELGYFLAKNPDVITALQKLPPAKQLVDIGKIEAKLTPFAPAAKGKTDDGAKPSTQGSNGKQAPQPAPRDTEATPSTARKAAPVITPISTNGSGSVEQNLETMNVRDHIAEFARKRGVNLTRRQRH